MMSKRGVRPPDGAPLFFYNDPHKGQDGTSPAGTTENSPPFQRWVMDYSPARGEKDTLAGREGCAVPGGTPFASGPDTQR